MGRQKSGSPFRLTFPWVVDPVNAEKILNGLGENNSQAAEIGSLAHLNLEDDE